MVPETEEDIMILTIYIIILIYFLLGGAGFYFISRKKDHQEARNYRIKYITYFVIIHFLFLSIIFNPAIFHYLGILIMITGLGEIIYLFRRSRPERWLFFMVSLVIYLVFCAAFFHFSRFNRNLILYTFLILSIFDSFSQISGQLYGSKKLFPSISPQKTLEGLAGGILIALISSLLLRSLTETTTLNTILMAAGIVLFAFIGDTATSFYKRKYGVKDFSGLLPGHGGFLDRFDSLIAGGAFTAFLGLIGCN